MRVACVSTVCPSYVFCSKSADIELIILLI